jgi:hypothetical protein
MPICFNKYCKNNVLASSDELRGDLKTIALQVIKESSDTSELLCAEPVMHNEKIAKRKVPYHELLRINNVSPTFIMQSLQWFCCSFVKDETQS